MLHKCLPSALLQEGEEDEEDASKDPHLSKAEQLDIWNYFFLSRTISSHLNCCDGISHRYPGSGKDQSLNNELAQCLLFPTLNILLVFIIISSHCLIFFSIFL